MNKFLLFLILNLFFIKNLFAEINYLYCIETLEKARIGFFPNKGEVESAAIIEHDDIKNWIKIHSVYPLSEKIPFLYFEKTRVENTELGFKIDLDEKSGKNHSKDFYDFIKLENKIIYKRSAYINYTNPSNGQFLLLGYDNIGDCENIDKKKYKSLLKQKSWSSNLK